MKELYKCKRNYHNLDEECGSCIRGRLYYKGELDDLYKECYWFYEVDGDTKLLVHEVNVPDYFELHVVEEQSPEEIYGSFLGG